MTKSFTFQRGNMLALPVAEANVKFISPTFKRQPQILVLCGGGINNTTEQKGGQ
jgi:hypothetical protein